MTTTACTATEALQQGRSAEDQGTVRIPEPVRKRRAFISPRPGTLARPASRPSPTRPAPQSQSLFRSYGSNLPTSLTYISLSTRGSSLPTEILPHLGDQLRIWVRTSATPPRGPLLDFQGPRRKIRTPPQLRCSSRSKPC
ncbi:hypothetical protein P5V15_002849 [Pogonomyrmex californicus]